MRINIQYMLHLKNIYIFILQIYNHYYISYEVSKLTSEKICQQSEFLQLDSNCIGLYHIFKISIINYKGSIQKNIPVVNQDLPFKSKRLAPRDLANAN